MEKDLNLPNEERNKLSRLLLTYPVDGLNFRVTFALNQGRCMMDAGQFIDFLTDLVEKCSDDLKQEAYKGLRLLIQRARDNTLDLSLQ